MAARANHGSDGVKSVKKPDNASRKCWEWLKGNAFILLLFLCTLSGYLVGLSLQSLQLSKQTIHLIGFPGQLMLRAFFMIIVPLLFCSLVLGVSSLRKGGDVKMVTITLTFFLGLSTFAAIMGATVGHIVHPGRKMSSIEVYTNSGESHQKSLILDSVLDLLWNAVPSNVIEATFRSEFTHVEVIHPSDARNPPLPFQSKEGLNETSLIHKKSIQKKDGINFMGLLVFSTLFGCALASLEDRGDLLHQVIDQLNSIIMKLMHYFLNVLPVGMFFWMFREGLVSMAPAQLLKHLGVFLGTAVGCFAFHQFVTFPLLYLLIVRKNPVTYHLNILPAIVTAFGTNSSALTLPMTVRCVEETNRIRRCVARFVLPLGMVVHMNGGALFYTLGTIFVAQLEGIELGATETVTICLTTILLSIAAPASSSTGCYVYLLTALVSAGIDKPQFISVVISMDWLMERFRTVTNVVGDCYVAAFVDKLCPNRLPSDTHDEFECASPGPVTRD